MQTRKAVIADQTQLKDCVQASLDATYGGLWSSEPLSVWDEDWTSARVACIDDRVVGVGLTRDDVLNDLWVHPSAQGLGAGTRLLAELEQEIFARGFSIARLRCLEPNTRARKFYASRGWTEVRVYPHETIPLNTVDMEKAADS
ncbi:GNAT family N-acetyltransferase [Phenylobacterium sp.]|uniref:GNAT family N-acetyltransferase n=1 Tax=Phenylobacterium sp. TaxID=1871053 RepID=UPI002FC9BA5C